MALTRSPMAVTRSPMAVARSPMAPEWVIRIRLCNPKICECSGIYSLADVWQLWVLRLMLHLGKTLCSVSRGQGEMAAVLASALRFDRRNEAADGLAPATAAEPIQGLANRKKKSGSIVSCRIDQSGKPQLSTPHIIEIPRSCNRSSPDSSKMNIGCGLYRLVSPQALCLQAIQKKKTF